MNILQYESKIWATADLLRGCGIKESEWPSFMMPFFALAMVESRLVRMLDDEKESIGAEAFAKIEKNDLYDLIKDKGQGYNLYIFEYNKTLSDMKEVNYKKVSVMTQNICKNMSKVLGNLSTTEFSQVDDWKDQLKSIIPEADSPLAIALVGEYDVGKSSIIKALTGEEVLINSNVATSEVKIYEYQGLKLIDMAIIFFLSAQTANESTKLSDQTIRDVAVVVVPSYSKMPQDKQENFVVDLRHTARKTAHVLLYTLLGILCMLAMFQLSMKIKMKILIAAIISTGYAATDELHQLFVNGRSPQITDVLIDFCGVLVGIMLVLLVHWAWSRKKYCVKPN